MCHTPCQSHLHPSIYIYMYNIAVAAFITCYKFMVNSCDTSWNGITNFRKPCCVLSAVKWSKHLQGLECGRATISGGSYDYTETSSEHGWMERAKQKLKFQHTKQSDKFKNSRNKTIKRFIF